MEIFQGNKSKEAEDDVLNPLLPLERSMLELHRCLDSNRGKGPAAFLIEGDESLNQLQIMESQFNAAIGDVTLEWTTQILQGLVDLGREQDAFQSTMESRIKSAKQQIQKPLRDLLTKIQTLETKLGITSQDDITKPSFPHPHGPSQSAAEAIFGGIQTILGVTLAIRKACKDAKQCKAEAKRIEQRMDWILHRTTTLDQIFRDVQMRKSKNDPMIPLLKNVFNKFEKALAKLLSTIDRALKTKSSKIRAVVRKVQKGTELLKDILAAEARFNVAMGELGLELSHLLAHQTKQIQTKNRLLEAHFQALMNDMVQETIRQMDEANRKLAKLINEPFRASNSIVVSTDNTIDTNDTDATETFKINLWDLVKKKTFQVDTTREDTIATLRTKMLVHTRLDQYRIKLPTEKQRLFFNGQVLDNPNSTLGAYNVEPDSTINVDCPYSVRISGLSRDPTMKRWLPLIVNCTDTIQEIKTRIFENEGIPVSEQGLIVARRLLKDTETLADCNVVPGKAIELSYKSSVLYPINIQESASANTYEIETADCYFVRDLKVAIEIKQGYPVKGQKLFLGSKELVDGGGIENYKITKNSTIRLVRTSATAIKVKVWTDHPNAVKAKYRSRTTFVEIEPTATIQDLKRKVQAQCNIPAAHQQLQFKYRKDQPPLRNEQTLQACNIVDGSDIHCLRLSKASGSVPAPKIPATVDAQEIVFNPNER